MKIHILRCGSISVPPAAAEEDGKKGLGAARFFAPDSRRVTLPVFAYLIEHPRGPVLVDCGWCRDISPAGVFDGAAVRAVLGAPLAAFFRPALGAGEAVHERLGALGLDEHDLELVIITHLDPDHVSGVKHVARAKRIIMPEDEYFWSCRTVYRLRQPRHLWIDYPIERVYYRGFPDVPNSWAIDVFGDGTLYMVNLPGHTDGMAAVVAVSGGSFAVMCADAAFSRRNWERLTPPGFGFDKSLQIKSLKWLREMSKKPGCAALLASHDADETRSVIEF